MYIYIYENGVYRYTVYQHNHIFLVDNKVLNRIWRQPISNQTHLGTLGGVVL